MKLMKKQILWLMMILIGFMPIQSAQQIKPSYYEKVGNYLGSDAGIELILSFTG